MRTLLSAALAFMMVTGSARADMTPDIAKAFSAALLRNNFLDGLPMRCLAYHTENETQGFLDASAYEIHGRDGCAGDPGTATKLADLRFMKRSKVVMLLDTASDTWKPAR